MLCITQAGYDSRDGVNLHQINSSENLVNGTNHGRPGRWIFDVVTKEKFPGTYEVKLFLLNAKNNLLKYATPHNTTHSACSCDFIFDEQLTVVSLPQFQLYLNLVAVHSRTSLRLSLLFLIPTNFHCSLQTRLL